nr:unnamed protein product [Spirometra erinaceieuropaei]
MSRKGIARRKLSYSKSDEWISTAIPPDEFNLKATLKSGQAFRWVEVGSTAEFVGVIGERVWRIRQSNDNEPVSFHKSSLSEAELSAVGQIPEPLVSYFRLDMQLGPLIQHWLSRDPTLRQALITLPFDCSNRFRGIRLLRQDPVETIMAFITSANNNVPRITKLLLALSRRYGKALAQGIDCDSAIYSFPTLEALANPSTRDELRTLGFGYRANFIPAAAQQILAEGGVKRLLELRNASYEETKTFLRKLPGIGNKVADCICLSCMDKVDVVPVDVHIARAAMLRGIEVPKSRSLTERAYKCISEGLSHLWSPYAGWAQVIAFSLHLHGVGGTNSRKVRSLNPLTLPPPASYKKRRKPNRIT